MEEQVQELPASSLVDQHPALEGLSVLQALQQLVAFRDNPWYTVLTNIMQQKADKGAAVVHNGFGVRTDILALFEREQVIGAAPAYLDFQKQSNRFLEELQATVKEQQTKSE